MSASSVNSFAVFNYSPENFLTNAVARKTGCTNLITETIMKMAIQKESEQSQNQSFDGSLEGNLEDSPLNLKEETKEMTPREPIKDHYNT